MHVPATNGFLLHLIKVTCWEEPNHDCKQRIRSIVKTSQVSSIDHLRDSALHLAKGKGFQTSQIYFISCRGALSPKMSKPYTIIIIIQNHRPFSRKKAATSNISGDNQALECRTPMWQCRNPQSKGDDEEACGHPEDFFTNPRDVMALRWRYTLCNLYLRLWKIV